MRCQYLPSIIQSTGLTKDDLFRSIHEAVAGNTLVLELLAKNLAAINTDEVFYSLADLLKDLQIKGVAATVPNRNGNSSNQRPLNA